MKATFEIDSISSHFQHDASRYRCCCGFHVLLSTKIVGIVHLILAVLAFGLTPLLPNIVSEWDMFIEHGLFIAAILIIPIGIITVCLLVGSFIHCAWLLVPFIGFCFVSMASQVAGFVLLAIYMNWGSGGEFGLLACLIGVCLEAWSLAIVLRCYRYLRDLEVHDAVEALCPPVFTA